MTAIKHQPRKPVAYSGTGSAVENYFKPAAEQEKEKWATFSSSKPNPQKRKVLFSLLFQAKWTTTAAGREGYKEVPDLDRLSQFLQSEKSPVKKKLIDMNIREMEKLIRAFKGIVSSTWK